MKESRINDQYSKLLVKIEIIYRLVFYLQCQAVDEIEWQILLAERRLLRVQLL